MDSTKVGTAWRRFTATYHEHERNETNHGEGIQWSDGTIALHWQKRATICFDSESALQSAYQCSQGCAFSMEYIDQ